MMERESYSGPLLIDGQGIVLRSSNQHLISGCDESKSNDIQTGRMSDTIADTGQKRRFWTTIRATYGEFMATCILMIPIYGCLANSFQNNWSSGETVSLTALVSGLQVATAIFTFSEMSGANMNPAISFALWLTNKLSNRKLIFYVCAQLIASIVSAGVIWLTFSDPTTEMFKKLAFPVTDGTDVARIFATEAFCTFILAYVAFAMAFEDAEKDNQQLQPRKSTLAATDGLTLFTTRPTSRSGFAPFAIGFTVFSLSAYGGTRGISLNPARMLGPAIFSGEWNYIYVYWLAECLGAGLASFTVHVLATHADWMDAQETASK